MRIYYYYIQTKSSIFKKFFIWKIFMSYYDTIPSTAVGVGLPELLRPLLNKGTINSTLVNHRIIHLPRPFRVVLVFGLV